MTEPELKKKPYRVVVADNFHYGEVDEQREGGEYAPPSRPYSHARGRRTCFATSISQECPPKSCSTNILPYDDPFVAGPDAPKFSAWTYAKEQCPAIIGANPLPREI